MFKVEVKEKCAETSTVSRWLSLAVQGGRLEGDEIRIGEAGGFLVFCSVCLGSVNSALKAYMKGWLSAGIPLG